MFTSGVKKTLESFPVGLCCKINLHMRINFYISWLNGFLELQWRQLRSAVEVVKFTLIYLIPFYILFIKKSLSWGHTCIILKLSHLWLSSYLVNSSIKYFLCNSWGFFYSSENNYWYKTYIMLITYLQYMQKSPLLSSGPLH